MKWLNQNVRPDGVALVAPDQQVDQVQRLRDIFAYIDVEVVEPEIHQHLFELPVGINRTEDLGLFEILACHLARRAQALALAAQLPHLGEALSGEERGDHRPLRWIQIGE